MCTEQHRHQWRHWTQLYEQASNAKVNQHKTIATPLLPATTDFSGIAGTTLPRDSTWFVGGIPHTVTGDANYNNFWDGIVLSIARIAKANHSRPLPWHIRVRLWNTFILSKLWHSFAIRQPLKSVIDAIAKMGRHFVLRQWNPVSWKTICLPRSKGGLGALDPQSQIDSFRASFWLRLLEHTNAAGVENRPNWVSWLWRYHSARRAHKSPTPRYDGTTK